MLLPCRVSVSSPSRPPSVATPAERARVYFANALLPAPLPTPPKSKMLPLRVVVVILPNPNAPPPKKPSRADTVQRWGARKDASSNPPSKPGRADAVAVARWDAHKTKPAATAAPVSSSSGSARSGSPAGRASSTWERWDSNKKTSVASSSASSGSTTSPAPSSGKWDSSKRRPAVCSRPSSPERCDAHKKPRPPRAAAVPDDDGAGSTGSKDLELDTPRPQLLPRALYAGPGFIFTAPEPSMLPMPSSLMVRAA